MIDCKRQNKRILISLFDNFIIIYHIRMDTNNNQK